MRIILVGAPGSGKTLLSINWCEYLGSSRIYYYEFNCAGRNGLGRKRRGLISPQTARAKMVQKNSGQAARTFIINRPGQSPSRLTLADTFSLKEKPVLTVLERKKLSFTLQMLAKADIVLHLVDLSCSDPLRREFVAEVDRTIFEFSTRHPVRYFLLGNKLDLLDNPLITPWWPASGPVTGVSAREGKGFERLTELIADTGGL